MNYRAIHILSVCIFGWLIAVSIKSNTIFAQPFHEEAPFVIAGTMDDRPRLLFVTQDRNFWVSYDTELGNVYRLWVGGLEDPALRSVSFLAESASTQGLILLENDKKQQWRIIRNGVVSVPEVSFLGYKLEGPQLILEYALETTYGHRILVEERPEFSLDRERPLLKRSFSILSGEEDIQVALDISIENLRAYSDLKTEGLFQRFGEKKRTYYWGAVVDVQGRLMISPNSRSSVAVTFYPDLIENSEDNIFTESSAIPRLRSIQAIDSEGIQPVLRRRSDHEVGISMRVFGIGEPIEQLAELAPGQLPNANQVVPAINLTQKDQFGGLDFYFITHLSGFLNIAGPGEFAFRVLADDGVRLTIADSVLLEIDQLQAAQPSEDVSIFLPAGIHSIEVEHFQSTGPKQLTVLWQPPWRNSFEVLQAPVLSTRKEEQRFSSTSRKYIKRPMLADSLKVYRMPIRQNHPSLEFEEIELPSDVRGYLGDIDVLSSGRIVATTWRGDGVVYILDGIADSESTINAKQIATGLNMPLGLKVVDDEIFVLQQHELTQLIDNDGNESVDEYRVVSNNWEVSTDYTELAMGLEYDQGHFYNVLGMPLDRSGAILIEDVHHRGVLVRTGFDGSQRILAGGMQLSGGISYNDRVMAASDQRNPWFSDSRVVFLSSNSRSDIEGSEVGYADLGSIWLPVNDGQSPTQPAFLKEGAFQGDWIVGDMVNPVLYRLALDEVDQKIQGVVFPFAAGLPTTFSRIVELHDGSLLAGGTSLAKPWGQITASSPLMYRVSMKEEVAFEMKSIQAVSGGFQIEFTREIDSEQALDIFSLYQWPNSETRRDRTRKRSGREELAIRTVELMEDGRTIRLLVDEVQAGHIVYFNLDPGFTSIENETLWANEAWYSVNALPIIPSEVP